MRYIYRDLSNDKAGLIEQIRSASERLSSRLVQIDLGNLDISDYNRRYWRRKIEALDATFQLYTYLLYLSLNDDNSYKDLIFVDYGGGTGFFSLLAREFGIGKIIYVDIYDVSCRDAEKIGEFLDLKADHYICGGIDETIDFFEKNSISADAVCSYDVIEHIYDIREFFQEVQKLFRENGRLVFASSANPANRFIEQHLMKVHRDFESEKRPDKWGRKKSDTLESYISVRKNIITDYSPELSSEAVDELAVRTRGLIKKDIEGVVDEFRETGNAVYCPNHPTNTCDPYTGNWVEQLIDGSILKGIVNEQGFDAEILPGFWGSSASFSKNCVKFLINKLITVFGKKSINFAPYYILYASKLKK